MKINKIERPNCGFPFEPKKTNDISICPHCKSSFYIDDEKQNISITNINNFDRDLKTPPKKTTGKGSLIAFIFPIVVIPFFTFLVLKPDNQKSDYAYREVPESEAFILFVEQLFETPLSDITQEDYQKVKYLSIRRNVSQEDWTNANSYPWLFEYAFDVDKEGAPIELKSALIETPQKIQMRDLQVFTNIVSAYFNEFGHYEFDDGSYTVNFQNLKSLEHFGTNTPFSLEGVFYDPSLLKTIKISRVETGEKAQEIFR